MGSVYSRKDSPFLWLKWRGADGQRRQERTRFRKGDPAQLAEARRALELLERRVMAERRLSDGVLTVRAFSESWLDGLTKRGVISVEQYRAKFRAYVLPELGDLPLREVRPHHVADLVESLRAAGALAPRTVRNIYGHLHGMFQRALRQELVPGNPCALESHELPENEDRDPAWRATAVFSRGEVERLLSDQRVPEDRRALYGLLFLGGVRIGESLDRRWSDYDAAAEPLGRLAVTTSWSSQDKEARATKTRVARAVPVHPVLAQMLAEWRLRGWAALMGRPARDEDLMFPEPHTARSRRADPGEEHRHAIVALKRLHRDLELLGLRQRRQHDARRTFISLAQADGAPPHLLKWVTHGHRSGVMDLYTTAPWAELCAAVAKLRIRRLGAREVAALPRAIGEGPHSGGGAPAERPLPLGDADPEPRGVARPQRAGHGPVPELRPATAPELSKEFGVLEARSSSSTSSRRTAQGPSSAHPPGVSASDGALGRPEQPSHRSRPATVAVAAAWLEGRVREPVAHTPGLEVPTGPTVRFELSNVRRWGREQSWGDNAKRWVAELEDDRRVTLTAERSDAAVRFLRTLGKRFPVARKFRGDLCVVDWFSGELPELRSALVEHDALVRDPAQVPEDHPFQFQTRRPVPEQHQRQFETAAGLTYWRGAHHLIWESDLSTSAVALICGCGIRLEADILKERSSEHVLFHELLARMGERHRAPGATPATRTGPPERDAGRVAGNISGNFSQAVGPNADPTPRALDGFDRPARRNNSPEGFGARGDIEAPRTTSEPDPSGYLRLAAREGLTVQPPEDPEP